MFLGWPSFFKQLKAVRLVNLAGSMGTGKTLLSVAIAYELLRRGHVEVCCSNFPVVFASPLQYRRSVFLYDEGGLTFDSRFAFKDKSLSALSSGLTFGLRKAGSYFLVPSFIAVDKRFRVGIRLWRVRASRWFWFFAWEVGPEDPDERVPGLNYWDGRLFLLFPSRYFGSFDTYFVPSPALTQAALTGWLAANDSYQPSDSETAELFLSWLGVSAPGGV